MHDRAVAVAQCVMDGYRGRAVTPGPECSGAQALRRCEALSGYGPGPPCDSNVQRALRSVAMRSCNSWILALPPPVIHLISA